MRDEGRANPFFHALFQLNVGFHDLLAQVCRCHESFKRTLDIQGYHTCYLYHNACTPQASPLRFADSSLFQDF
jgi:hypothetical protein